MNKNKEAARVLEHPNGNNRREIATPRVSIVHHPRRDFKRQAAKLVLTVCGLVFLTSIVGIAEGGGIPAACYMVGSVLTANHAAGVLLADNREE